MNAFLAISCESFFLRNRLQLQTTINLAQHQQTIMLCIARAISHCHSIHKCECHNKRICCPYTISLLSRKAIYPLDVDYIFIFNLLRAEVDSLCCAKATHTRIAFFLRKDGRNRKIRETNNRNTLITVYRISHLFAFT